jgi:malonate decarboxylase gamma subunit
MEWSSLAERLFPDGHTIQCEADFLCGTGTVEEQSVAVIGTTHHALIGVEIALRTAGEILKVVRNHPGRPLVLLVDTEGQRLRHRDELLGINSYMAHLGKCVEMARLNGHRVVALVYDQALSGGFITSGMMADACFALPDAEIRVMNLRAMARVTKIPQERLEALSKASPVFAPGATNYLRMGGVEAIWEKDLAEQLAAALRQLPTGDQRSALGFKRGGRLHAHPVAQQVRENAGS